MEWNSMRYIVKKVKISKENTTKAAASGQAGRE